MALKCVKDFMVFSFGYSRFFPLYVFLLDYFTKFYRHTLFKACRLPNFSFMFDVLPNKTDLVLIHTKGHTG